jgi:aldehyde dehydrogenase (NAD+)
VLGSVTNEHPIASNEHFGPIAPVIEVHNEHEAITVANDIDRGLSASVWSRDTGRATRVGKQIESGMVHINDHTIGNEAHVPFGGMKHSGIGRYNDEPLIRELTETQCLVVQQ